MGKLYNTRDQSGKSIRTEYKGLSIEVFNRTNSCHLYINGKLEDSYKGVFLNDMIRLQGKGFKKKNVIVILTPQIKVFAKYEIWYKETLLKSGTL